MQSWTQTLNLSAMESERVASSAVWRTTPSRICRPGALYELETHGSILAPPDNAHEAHAHVEEELTIVLSGSAGIVRAEPGGHFRTSPPLGRGAFAYHASVCLHTIRSCGPAPVIYFCVKWTGRKTGNAGFLESADFAPEYPFDPAREWTNQAALDSGTEMLTKLHCHTSVMKPGVGYEPHADTHDVLLVVLDGEIETLGRRLGPDSVVFCQSGEPHGLKSVGSSPARYLVFEFHREGLMRRLPRFAKAALRRWA
jgi:mannose-6-phosphate isomerase-like protein (cupin superfamily)